MYRLNNNRLLCESEILDKKAADLESCLKRLDVIESKLSQLDDDHLMRMAAHIRKKIIEQQNTTRKFSHVFSSAANTAADSDRRSYALHGRREITDRSYFRTYEQQRHGYRSDRIAD